MAQVFGTAATLFERPISGEDFFVVSSGDSDSVAASGIFTFPLVKVKGWKTVIVWGQIEQPAGVGWSVRVTFFGDGGNNIGIYRTDARKSFMIGIPIVGVGFQVEIVNNDGAAAASGRIGFGLYSGLHVFDLIGVSI